MCCGYSKEPSHLTYVVGTQKKRLIYICCGYSKEPSFEQPKQMLKLMNKKIITILNIKRSGICTYDIVGR